MFIEHVKTFINFIVILGHIKLTRKIFNGLWGGKFLNPNSKGKINYLEKQKKKNRKTWQNTKIIKRAQVGQGST